MFHKLRVKLTIFNLVVIGFILILLALFAYFRTYQTISSQIYEEMWQIVLNDDSVNKQYFPSGSVHYKYNYNYMKVDMDGNILESSFSDSISQEDLMSIKSNILNASGFAGEILLMQNNSYLFLKAQTNNSDAMTIVFVNALRKQELLAMRIKRTIILSIFSLILVFSGSLFISQKALIPIKKAWEKQQSFTADVSHELRTPLAVIQTTLELIMTNPDETVKSQEKWLKNILKENKRMTKLVDDLLTLARSDTHQNLLDKSLFMLDELTEEVVSSFMPYAQKESKHLHTDCDSSIAFLGDRSRIKQLLVILIDNAFKYSGEDAKVSVRLKNKGKFAELVVSDNGIGIEKSHLDKIFDRFYRVDEARCRNENSLGLGLSIAKWIVEEHKGTISVESTPGTGTEFTILLPLK